MSEIKNEYFNYSIHHFGNKYRDVPSKNRHSTFGTEPDVSIFIKSNGLNKNIN
jgi:hypothetical protein